MSDRQTKTATKPPNPEAEGNADEQHSEATPTPQHQRWMHPWQSLTTCSPSRWRS